MINIYKMDMHRLKHSKVFYVAIIFITIMAFATVMSGMSTTLGSMLGAADAAPSFSAGSAASADIITPDISVSGDAAADGDAFMSMMMGTSVVFILISIILTLFVCGDYSGGFANNIFAAHSNPWDYIGGKMMSMATTSGFLLILFTVESVISLMAFGHEVTLSGGIIGLIFFLFEKWLISCALSSVILLVTLFTRNIAWGIVAGFLIATGGLTMGVALFANHFGFDWLINIFSITISGSSQICTLSFSGLILLRVILASAAWIAIGCFASSKVLKSKDI